MYIYTRINRYTSGSVLKFTLNLFTFIKIYTDSNFNECTTIYLCTYLTRIYRSSYKRTCVVKVVSNISTPWGKIIFSSGPLGIGSISSANKDNPLLLQNYGACGKFPLLTLPLLTRPCM
jgi:hypothetical protein